MDGAELSIVLVLLLGLQHGFDPDHLAAIDGLTRYNLVRRPRLARWCGTLFSAGHGAVVTAVAFAFAITLSAWEPPRWFAAGGAWIAIAVLVLIGLLNLRALRASPGGPFVPVGLRGGLLADLLRVDRPAPIAGVGALFALSFDTISLAGLFAMTGSMTSGVGHATLLGAAFTAGMMATDALNGYWIYRLLRASSGRRHGRALAWVVIGLSFAVAAYGALRMLSPAIDDWYEGRALALGLATIVVVTLVFLAGAARERRSETHTAC